VVTTASPKNFDLVKSRGADAVFDYRDPECAAKIRAYTKDSLRYVFNTVSGDASIKICAESFPASSTEELSLVSLLPVSNFPRADVKTSNILAYTSFGEGFSKFGMDFPPMKEHYESGVRFWGIAEELIRQGKVVPHPVAQRAGGLAGIPDG
jgi:NADPH:quinone reductase-like Zn-dependent oxidoreductase